RIGVKVWVCRGEVFGKRDLSPNIGLMKDKKSSGQGNEERGGKFGAKRRTKREDK
ncbi:MAG: 30S ribosomal protein S3, partial [Bacteroidia bacterium]|nr:30S ribosomal protein S3 [Bacteroidia bacterium]